jgi:predicted dienelactone hydrolase
LTENIASKGYVVVAIDHTESTFRDAAPFQSTLLNRSTDILFVIDEITKIGASGKEQFLNELIDSNNTAVIGYSMGGYGALNAAGAAYSEFALNFFKAMTGGSKALDARGIDSQEFINSYDPRIKAVIALAPWGMERGVWNAETLKGLKVPSFFIVGSQDDISGYEKGVKAIYEGAINSERYLLTYKNARHNVAPNPPPTAALKPGLHIDEYYRYAEPAWNERRLNNINQHFVTAFLGTHLKKQDYGKYLKLPENSNSETWTGFVPRSSPGMELLHAVPKE